MPRRAWLVLLLLLLTTSTRIEHLQRVQSIHTYYFPTIGKTSLPPFPAPVGSMAKKGVGLTHSACASFGSWGYDWSSNPPKCTIETIPMIWGANIPTAVGGNSRWVMGFNEPDLPSQSNISPTDAVVLWEQVEQNFPDKLLVSPAPSDQHPEWLVNFRNAYIQKNNRPPRLDALAIHCYFFTAVECESLVQKYEGYAQSWGIGQIWVSEFSFMTQNIRTQDQAWEQDSIFIQWMDNERLVGRYAFFASRIWETEPWAFPAGWNTSLLNMDGSLTFWGLHYQ